MTPEQKRIMDIWDETETLNPDKSLEWLTAVTGDIAGVDHMDVIDALVARQEEKAEK